MEHKQPPRILTDAGLNMFVDTVKLRELSLPIVDVDLYKLIWHFDMPVWAKDKTDEWNLTPWEVIEKRGGTKGHQERTKKADAKYPIIVTKYRSKYVVLDGVHRLVKAFVNNEKKIKAKIIPRKYLLLKKFQS